MLRLVSFARSLSRIFSPSSDHRRTLELKRQSFSLIGLPQVLRREIKKDEQF